jgi:sulfite oxidase
LLAKTEAVGAWQRGLNYKTLPPNVTDAKNVNLDEMPSMTEVSTFSGITHSNVVSEAKAKPGNTVTMKAEGWAWAGGGRNIVRVDVTGDGGKSWATAKLTEGNQQRFGRSWAWVFWECDVLPWLPKMVPSSLPKAVDLAFNSQPESSDHGWNVRGLGNNAGTSKQ